MRFRSALRFAPAFLVFALLAGCNGQSEGQACSIDNGNSDCADNLVCMAEQGVVGDRCCPSNVGQSTTAVCGVHQVNSSSNTATPVADAGSAGTDADVSSPTADATTAADAGQSDAEIDGSAE